jgi:hypothetical protein
MRPAYILTNGFVESSAQEFNYVRLFRTIAEAENYAKIVKIQLKYDFYEIEIPENMADKNTSNIMVVLTSNHEKHVKYVENYDEYSKTAFNYYKRQHNKIYKNSSDSINTYSDDRNKNTITKVTNNVIFRNELTIVQMFGQRDLNHNSYIYVGNIQYN